MSGKEAVNKPAAGIGTPLKPAPVLGSTLKLAKAISTRKRDHERRQQPQRTHLKPVGLLRKTIAQKLVHDEARPHAKAHHIAQRIELRTQRQTKH